MYAKKDSVMGLIALAVVCLILTVVVGRRMPVIGVVFAVGTVYFLYSAWAASRRDPYGLRELKQVHDQEEIRQIIAEEDGVCGGGLYCERCDQSYSADFSVCPRCGGRRCG